MTKTQELQQESLGRAIHNQTISNYPAIFQGFMRKGIAEDEIKPRVNVFTYNAWRALGRQVRKGEHGVKVVTFIQTKGRETDKDTGERKTIRRPWTTTVFHVSQTEPIGAQTERLHLLNEAFRAVPGSPRQNEINSKIQALDSELEHDATAENVPYAGESVSQESLELEN